MKHIFSLFAFAMAMLAGTVSAQNAKNEPFEGKILQHYQKKGSPTMLITWYIKGDKIAFDVAALQPAKSDEPVFRFVPDVGSKKLKMRQLNGSFQLDINADAIQMEGEADKIEAAKETGRGNIEPHFEKMVNLQARTPSLKIELEYTPDIAIDWQPLQALFKSDYAINAMLRLSAKGFPYQCKGTNASGEIIFEYSLEQVQREKIADSVFR